MHGATPVMTATQLAFDNEMEWLREAAYDAPLSVEQIADVQREIDGVVGITRDNRSIAKLIWSGDRRYWKEYHDQWEPGSGKPVGEPYRRPIIQYRSIFEGDSDVFVRDAFPPRWLIMTLMEPEQYVSDWGQESKFWHPELQMNVQVLPEVPPKERLVYYMTVAIHQLGCCQRAETEDRDCWGKYAHPRHALETLARAAESVKDMPNTSFDSPDRLARRLRDYRNTNNYIEQALTKFAAQREAVTDEAELALATREEWQKAGNLLTLRKMIRSRTAREIERMDKTLTRRKNNE